MTERLTHRMTKSLTDLAADGGTPIYQVIAGSIDSTEVLDMVLYTSGKGGSWERRGVIDGIYIDKRAKLVSIGVDLRDMIDVDIDAEIVLMTKSQAQ